MIKANYQLALEQIIKDNCGGEKKPKLLLQACCAPCSSYVIEYLNIYFNITLFFYNPNISPKEEFLHRFNELERLVKEMPLKNPPAVVCADYENFVFEQIVCGLENAPEGGERCAKCYRLRLEKTADYAKENGFDYFGTTLSISPHKNAQKLNEIGGELAEKYGVSYLFSDFKKKEGYKRSIILSQEYNLYRQNYCGCIYSKNTAEKSC